MRNQDVTYTGYLVLTYKGFNACISYDAENEVFVGNITNLKSQVRFHCEKIEEVEATFVKTINFHIYNCHKHNISPSELKTDNNGETFRP